MKAVLRYLGIAPRKARMVANLVRGKGYEEAVSILTFTQRSASAPIKGLVESAFANARDKQDNVDSAQLFIKEIFVDEGPILKRFMPRAQGRATRINKRTSHITCVLGTRD